MVAKLEIERYCNRYEELFALVRSLDLKSIKDESKGKIKVKLQNLSAEIAELLSGNSKCSVLTEEDKKSFGILAKETEDIKSIAEKTSLDMNTLFYFMVCSKMPVYMTKVSKTMKHTFIDAAVSLYYLERFYLMSSVAKLIQLECELKLSGSIMDTIYLSVAECVDVLRSTKCLEQLVKLLEADITSLVQCPLQHVKLILDEISMIHRLLFFHYSYVVITPDDFIHLVELNITSYTYYKSLQRTRKEEPIRSDAMFETVALLDTVQVVSVMRQQTADKAKAFTKATLSDVIKTMRDKRLEQKTAVAGLVLGIYGLQLDPESRREYMSLLRHSFRHGVFSTLYHDIVFIHSHTEDVTFSRILSSLLFDMVRSYLVVQSSQWHEMRSKQFYVYEQPDSQTAEKEDGLETVMYLLQYLLTQLSGIVIALSGNSLEESPFAYFCSMISDRLRAEPYLFNTYIGLLTSFAETSPASASAVYQFVEKAPSEHVSWPLILASLNEGERLLQTDTAQRGLLDPDVTGFIAILGLLASVLRNCRDCPSVCASLQVDTVHLCIRLLHQPVHVVLKARLCSVLACVAVDCAYAQLILRQLEFGRILTNNTSSGVRYELETVESAAHAYPLTTSFLDLLLALIQTLGARALLGSSAFVSIMEYVLSVVFLQYDQRLYLATRSGEKWKLPALCLRLLASFTVLFQELSQDVLTEEERGLQQRLSSVIAELLSGSEVLRKILSLSSLTPSHSFVLSRHLATDMIAESSVFVDFRLFDAYRWQVQFLRDSAVLLRQLMEVTPEAILRLGLRAQVAGVSALVNSLASQLLADGHSTMSLLLHITDVMEPGLQLTALRVLRLLADQLKTELFVTLLDAYPAETAAIRSACNQLLLSTLFTRQQDESLTLAPSGDLPAAASEQQTRTEACRVLLDLLVAHVGSVFPSAVSTLLALPQSLTVARVPGSLSCMMATLLTFLDSPGLVVYHAMLAYKVTRLLFSLCSHRDRIFLSEICSVLLDRQTFSRLLSALPYLQQIVSHSEEGLQSVLQLRQEEELGIMDFTAHVLRILVLLLHIQKRLGLSLQLLGVQLEAMLHYDITVCRSFTTEAMQDTSPLLDTLSRIDQRFAEPEDMPRYLNDCAGNCWVQRQLSDTTYQQLDLLRLAWSVFQTAQNSGSTVEQARFFVEEATAWARHWNQCMEQEALKSLAFAAGCRLLHMHLIENYETILLVPRFADCPTDLHVAVMQALLALVVRANTFDRPYLAYLGDLLLDVFSFLHSQSGLPMAVFTQQSMLTGLLQAVLSPVVQQRQEKKSCRLRGQLYLPLLAFLTLAMKQGSFELLQRSLLAALPLLLPSLAHDTSLADLEGRAAALALLNLLLQSSVGDEAMLLLLAESNVLNDLLRLFSLVDTPILQDTTQCRQQRDVVHRVLHVLIAVASDRAGAGVLLNLSIFTIISRCPLLLLSSPLGYAVHPNKLDGRQKDSLRGVLQVMLCLLLTLVHTLRAIRGLRDEVLLFIRSSLNLSLLLLEDTQNNELLALETLSLYEAMLALLACDRKDLATELNGFEQVIAARMMENLKRVSEDKMLCAGIRELAQKEEEDGKGDRRMVLQKRIVENSIVYLCGYGEAMPVDILKSLGYQ